MRMKSNGLVRGTLLGALSLFAVAIFAMPPAPGLPKGKIKLTKAQVEKCVKVIPSYFATFKNATAKLKQNGMSSPAAGVKAMLASKSMTGKLMKFATANGYSDFNEFVKTFAGVMMAYSYLKIEKAEKMIAGQLKQMPQMAAMIKPQLDQLKKIKKQCEAKLAPETIAAVTPFLAKIDAAVKNGNCSMKPGCCPCR